MLEKIGEGTKFGRYVLLDKVGSGGMAEIYRAKTFGAAGFEKEFAVKLILPNLVDDSEFVDMFINEAKIAVSLYHANIVQVFDLGEIDEQFYIAMEFVLGKDLLDVLATCADKDIKIPLNLVLFVTMEMLKGLNFAHRAKNPYGEDLNIIHRDVSPSNIMISYGGDVKVGDFGVAKAAFQRNRTESGTLKGKVGYMSPEQVMGEDIDLRSDVFSAGVVFFEALTMGRLFTGNSDLEVMLKVRDADIAERLEQAGPIPTDLLDIVQRALTKHPEERYQSSGEFYQALVDFCYNHSIKVTGTDLSNFMRRIFADEIEREKAKRRSDPRQADAISPVSPAAQSLAQLSTSAEDIAATANSYAEASGRLPYENTGDFESPVSPSNRPSTLGDEEPTRLDVFPPRVQGDTYRYRDENGLIYGPVDLDTLVALFEEGGLDQNDRVSVNTGPWVAPEEVDALRALQSQIIEDESWKTIDETDALSDQLRAAVAEADGEDSEATAEAIRAMRDQYASYEGDLQHTPFSRILARLHKQKATGRLHVQDRDIEKSIFFREGEPILVNSNKKDELLGSFLIRRGMITQSQLEQALARLSEWGGRLGDALVAIGAVPAHDIFELLAAQMREKILDVFTWSDGHYGYYENQEPETMGYPLGVDTYSVIVEACRHSIYLGRIESYYAGRERVTIYRGADSPIDPEQLGLTARELAIFNQVEGGARLAELLTSTGDRELALRTVYLLHQVELFRFETTEQAKLPKA